MISICRHLDALRPSIEWLEEWDLEVEGREFCMSALAANSSTKITKVIFGVVSCFS